MSLTVLRLDARIVLLWLFCLAGPDWVAAQQPAVRKWVDKTGKHELEGKFTGLEGQEVVLETKDGKRMKIKLDLLSFDDQKYALEQSAKMKTENPFKESSGSPSSQPSADEAGPAAKIVTVRWNTAKILNPRTAPAEWKLEPDPEPQAAPRAPTAIPLPKKRDFFEAFTGTAANASEGLVCVAHKFDRGGKKDTRLEVVDLGSGKVVRESLIENCWSPLAVMEGGNTVVLRSDDFGFGGKERLTVWKMNPDKSAAPLKGWVCSQSRQGSARDISWAAPLQQNRFATLTSDGRLTIWDLDTAEPKAYMDMGRDAHAAVTPGGRFILCGIGSALVAIDAMRTRLVGSLTIPEAANQPVKVNVSPDGSRFAFGFGSVFHVYNYATGQREQEVVGVSTFGDLVWADDSNLLVGSGGSRVLVNLDHGFVVWTYTGMEDALRLGPNTWFSISTDKSGGLFGIKMPRKDAREAVDRALQDPNFFAVTQGRSVRIDTSGMTDPNERQRAQEALEKKLQANGILVNDGAPVTVVAEVKRGMTRKVEFRSFGQFAFAQGDVRDVTEWVSGLRIQDGDKTIWEAYSTVFPTHFTLQEGESLDQALARLDKPDYRFFQSIVVPRNIPKEGGRGGLGTTDLSQGAF